MLGLRLLCLSLRNLAAVIVSFVQFIVDSKLFFCFVFVCCSYFGLFVQGSVVELN